MLDAAPVLAYGFGLGLSLAMPPGPILAFAAERAARGGFWPGVVVALGATTGDGTQALLMGFGVIRIVGGYPVALALLTLAGAVLMAWFAWGAWRTARRPPDLRGDGDGRFASLGLLPGGFVAGYLFAVTSPFNYAWWLGVGTSLFHDYGAIVFVGFFAALVTWSFAFTGAVVWASGRVRSLVRGVSYASAALLAAFAVQLLWTGARDLASLA